MWACADPAWVQHGGVHTMSNGGISEPTIHHLIDLSGRVALITGATGWLGSAFARALAEAGATVVISSRDAGRAAEAAAPRG